MTKNVLLISITALSLLFAATLMATTYMRSLQYADMEKINHQNDSLDQDESQTLHDGQLGNLASIDLPEIVTSISGENKASVLRISMSISVTEANREKFEDHIPEIMNIILSYLQTLEKGEVLQTGSLVLMRLHILSRLQAFLGEDNVRNVLISNFLLS